MAQVSAKLRSVENGGLAHWCPACDEMHVIWIGHNGGPNWSFDGNYAQPTFAPSVRVTYNGPDAGQDRGDGWGKAPPACCHYFVKAGRIEFCSDCSHELAGQTVDLPDLPPEAR